MAERQTILAVVFCGLVLAGSASGDMMPAFPPTCGSDQASAPGARDAFPLPQAFSGFPGSLPGRSLAPAPIVFRAEAEADDPLRTPAPSVYIVADRHDSLGLCLYAFLSLGLCRSAPLVRRLSFNGILLGYCDGGPTHFGLDLAISPDGPNAGLLCLLSADAGSKDLMRRYRVAAVVSLWRQAQCAPGILAARAPPLRGS